MHTYTYTIIMVRAFRCLYAIPLQTSLSFPIIKNAAGICILMDKLLTLIKNILLQNTKMSFSRRMLHINS